jgi:hypothetical protein
MTLTRDWTDGDFVTLRSIADELGGVPLDLLSVLYAESGAQPWSLNDNPKKRRKPDGTFEEVPLDGRYNAAGLNQCMPFILRNLGFHPELGPRARAEAFCKLSVSGQLPLVRAYFAPFRGKLHNATAWYLANFMPAYIARATEPDFVLADEKSGGFSGQVFAANAAFDADGDRKIEVRELGQAIVRNFRGARASELADRLEGRRPIPPPAVVSVDTRTWLGAQTVLERLGHYHGDLDGLWGPLSRRAVVDFQKAHGLTPDGIYGPRTRAELERTFTDRTTPPTVA